MSKCPFWSKPGERVECNNECPMQNITVEDSNCAFKEHASTAKFSYKDIIEKEFDNSSEGFEESLLGIRIEKEITSY